MAAAGIVTMPVHIRMNSPRAYDLRKCIEIQAVRQPASPISAQVAHQRTEDFAAKEHDRQLIASKTSREVEEDSADKTRPQKNVTYSVEADEGHEKQLRHLGERLLAAQAEQQRLRESKEALEREREAWHADKERWAVERRLLLETALEMRRMRDETERETSDWLQRLVSSASESTGQHKTSETGIKSELPPFHAVKLAREWQAAASTRRRRHIATVTEIRDEVSTNLLEFAAPILDDDVIEASKTDETLPSIEDEDVSMTVSNDGDDRLLQEDVSKVETSNSCATTAAVQGAAGDAPGSYGSFLLEQYMKVYSLVYGFKTVMARMTKSDDTAEPIVSDQAFPTFEEIEAIATDVGNVLRAACSAMDTALNSDLRVEPTLAQEALPEDRRSTEERSAEEMVADAISEGETLHQRIVNLHAEQKIIGDVQIDDVRSNAALIAAMQDQVNDLQVQLNAASSSRMEASPSTSVALSRDDSSLFTRLDGERNTKILKRAIAQNRISTTQANEAIGKMDAYLDLTRQRLMELTTKYIHQASAEPAKVVGGGFTHTGRRLDDQNEHELLAKMESLQAVRHKQWKQKMEALGTQRTRLAAGLVEALENIEKDTGLFLVKPTLLNQKRRTLEQGRKPTRPETTVHDSRSLDAFAAEQFGQQSIRDRRRAYSSMEVAHSSAKPRAHREHLKRTLCRGDSGSAATFGATTSRSSTGPFMGLFLERCSTALQRPKAFTRSSVAPTATWTYQPPSSSPPPTSPTAVTTGNPTSSGRSAINQSKDSWLAAPRILALDIQRFTFAHERAAAPVTSDVHSASGMESRHRRSGGTASAYTRSYVTVARAARLPAGCASRSCEVNGPLETEVFGNVGKRDFMLEYTAPAAAVVEAQRNDKAKILEHVTIPAVRHGSATRLAEGEDAEVIVASAAL